MLKISIPAKIFICVFGILLLNMFMLNGAEAATKKKAKTPATESYEVVHKKLQDFAIKSLTSMNKYIVPSLGKKKVTQDTNGSFIATYIEMDTKTLATSFEPPKTGSAVTYIGQMSYDEVEYQCIGKTKAEALKNTCSSVRRESLTELIKYKKGKWGY